MWHWLLLVVISRRIQTTFSVRVLSWKPSAENPRPNPARFLFTYTQPPRARHSPTGLQVPVAGCRISALNSSPTLKSGFKLPFVSDGKGDLKKTFGPEDVFHYIYAVLHSPEYRHRYANFMKSDFPRIPLPTNRALFSALILPGERLVSLHLMEADDRRAAPAFQSSGSNQVDQVRYAPPSSGLPGASGLIANSISRVSSRKSGRPPSAATARLRKWLKDRKGRTLSEDDIDHYRKIVAALTDTRRLMTEIDEVIGKHGGWPRAFQTRRGAEPRSR